jgi:hypothetical protein
MHVRWRAGFAAAFAHFVSSCAPPQERRPRQAEFDEWLGAAAGRTEDAHGFRGWGDDRRGASFPCPAGKKGNTAS